MCAITPDHILAMTAEQIVSFLKDQTNSRGLNALMKSLNDLALRGDAKARAAIEHLGFPVMA